MKRFWIILTGFVLLASSCIEGEKAVLRSVSIDEDDVMIPVGGTVEILFQIYESDFTFDLDKDVLLYLGKGPFTASQTRRLRCDFAYRACDVVRKDILIEGNLIACLRIVCILVEL